ncbi:MAG: ABC-F family ATP-binding cassette domain-containing protein [Clostridia bacterium]|nr:ABC-F family ATP-binding cassette domain-containing protein [Clostridia bacterium]
MGILHVSGLSKYFGDRAILKGVSFSLEPGEKAGLVGKNGAGKTTLFRLLTGEERSDGGSVTFGREAKISYLSQFVTDDRQKTLWDEMMGAFSRLIEKENELERLTEALSGAGLSEGERERLILRHARLHEEFEGEGGLYYKSRVAATLKGLGFTGEDFSRPLSTLSGGQLSKLALSKLLLSDSNLLLLDEPTNHLDIEAIEWLEDFLRNFSGAFIVISHDRYFLDRVTNKTIEIDRGELSVFSCPYSEYLERKEGEEEYIRRRYENTMREIRRIEGIVKKQRQWNRERNIKTAESKLKQIERIKKTLIEPKEHEKRLSFSFAPAKKGSFDALMCEGVGVSYEGEPVLSDISFDITDKERVFLLGRNGSGKTTLLRAVMGEIPHTGSIKTGVSCDIAYYDQLGGNIRGDGDVISEVWDDYPDLTETEVRSALAAFLFTGEEVFKSVSELSGGERARIALLKVMLRGANFLILDEPTNHLDIYSKEALEDALIEYGGTMLVISHDRYFINKLCDRILYLSGGRASDFSGSYDEFAARRREAEENAPKSEKKADAKAEFLKKKQTQSLIRSLGNKISRAEEEIARLEAELSEIERALSDSDTASDYKKMMELTGRQAEINEKLSETYEAWEALGEELAALSDQ